MAFTNEKLAEILDKIAKADFNGLNENEVRAVVATQIQPLVAAQAEDQEKFAVIQAAIDALNAGDVTHEQAIEAIVNALPQPTPPAPPEG